MMKNDTILKAEAERNYERLRRAERKLVRKRGSVPAFGLWFGRLFILPHTIIGVCLMVYPFLVAGTILWGTDVNATVFDKFTFNDAEDGRVNKIAIRYKYDGKTFVDKESVGYLEYESFNVGDPVVVRFLPPPLKEYTHQFRRPGEAVKLPDLGSIAFFAFFAIFWNLICGVFVAILYVWPVVNWWLLRWGAVSQCLVTKKSSYSDSDGDKHLSVQYTFIPGRKLADFDSLSRGDRERQVSSKTSVNRELFEQVQEGDVLNVVHTRRWPSVNTVFEFSDVDLESA